MKLIKESTIKKTENGSRQIKIIENESGKLCVMRYYYDFQGITVDVECLDVFLPIDREKAFDRWQEVAYKNNYPSYWEG